jgi:hypothetical protein
VSAPPIDLEAPAREGEPAPVAAARAFLSGGALAGPLPEEVAEALVEALVRRGAADRLGDLARALDKALAKRARKGLHLLRARGVKAEIPQPQTAPRATAPAEAEEAPALVSATIRDGERLVWYLRHHDTGGLEVMQARFAETDGLTQFEVGVLPRRQWREVEQELAGDTVLLPTRAPRGWVRWLIEEAWQQATEAGRNPPRRYAEVRHLLEPAERPAEHPVRALVAGIAVERRSDRVLELPEARTWIPDEAAARKAYEEIERLATSPLLVDERQRVEQIRDALRRAGAEAMAGPWRGRLERRLLDTAYKLATGASAPQRDRTRDLLADAALCVAAAAEVADPARGAEDVALVRALFDLLVPKEGAPAPGGSPAGVDPGNLIITP